MLKNINDNKTKRSPVTSKHGHKRLIIIMITILVIIIAVVVPLFMAKPFDTMTQSSNTATTTEPTPNDNDGNNNNDTIAVRQNGNTSTTSTNISKDTATNTASASVTTVTNKGIDADVTITDSTGDADLDTKIVKAITLLSSCAGNNDTPDEQAGNDAGLTAKSYFERFASKPDETYTPEDMPSNSDNLVELYRMSEHASILYPKLSARMIKQIDFISEGQEDDAKTYTVRVSCTDTYKNEFGGKKDVSTLLMDTILINPDDGTILSVRERKL